VVLAIIVLLVSILLAALNRAREQARRVQCLSNLHQLTIAWLEYANEHKGRICSSETQGYAGDPSDKTVNEWTYNFDSGASSPLDVTVSYAGLKTPPECFFSWIGGRSTKLSVEAGVLWPYLRSTQVYRCPDYQAPGPTSYQINGLLAGRIGIPTTLFSLREIRKAEGTFVFIEGWDSTGVTFVKTRPPNPIDLYQITILFNSFQTPISPKPTFTAGGIPGQNHPSLAGRTAGTGISFADGHAIFWQYADARTGNLAEAFSSGQNDSFNADPNDPKHQLINTPTEAAANSPDVFQLEAWSGGPIPKGMTQ